jgi:hypothetical protein
MLTLRALVLGLAATLALPGVAQAARTFTLGKGYSPAVAVEKDGTGHFAWLQDGGATDKLRYCQVPRGKSACEKSRTFTGTGDARYRNWQPFVFVKGQEITLLASFRRPQSGPVITDHFVVRSSDGGNSFGTPNPVGDPDRAGSEDAVMHGSDLGLIGEGAVYMGTNVAGAPIRGQSSDLGTLVAGSSPLQDPSVALAGNSPLVTADYRRDTRVFRTSHSVQRASFGATFWTESPKIPDQVQASLAGGPKGVYAMLLSMPNGRCPCRHVFRRWGGTRFAAPFDTQQDFTGTGASTGGNHDLFQDGAGRLHAVWTKTRGSGHTQAPTDVRYARSSGGTADFSKPITLAARGRNTNPLDLNVATAGDGRGFVTWEEPGDTATGSQSAVRTTVVAPDANK